LATQFPIIAAAGKTGKEELARRRGGVIERKSSSV
jgi:hypothetical protein